MAAGQPPSAPSVLKVEPPSWWAGHTINPVRLLVRGTNLHGARVRATRAGTEAGDVLTNSAGTYAFVNLRVAPDAAPGDYPLTLETTQGNSAIPFEINAPLDPQTNFQGVTRDDVIYLNMPDRFANGDPANDVPAGSPAEANDRKNPRAFHGGDLRGLLNRLPCLKD
ncbi:MAG: cyclomaltodextrinase N-terminal domain-containing protein, partial [Pyrinomonadaceae bacterium]